MFFPPKSCNSNKCECFFFLSEFQKKVLTKLIEIHMEVRRLGRSEPAFSATHIKRLECVEDFEREEQRLSDTKAFDTLVEFTRESVS